MASAASNHFLRWQGQSHVNSKCIDNEGSIKLMLLHSTSESLERKLIQTLLRTWETGVLRKVEDVYQGRKEDYPLTREDCISNEKET